MYQHSGTTHLKNAVEILLRVLEGLPI